MFIYIRNVIGCFVRVKRKDRIEQNRATAIEKSLHRSRLYKKGHLNGCKQYQFGYALKSTE